MEIQFIIYHYYMVYFRLKVHRLFQFQNYSIYFIYHILMVVLFYLNNLNYVIFN